MAETLDIIPLWYGMVWYGMVGRGGAILLAKNPFNPCREK